MIWRRILYILHCPYLRHIGRCRGRSAGYSPTDSMIRSPSLWWVIEIYSIVNTTIIRGMLHAVHDRCGATPPSKSGRQMCRGSIYEYLLPTFSSYSALLWVARLALFTGIEDQHKNCRSHSTRPALANVRILHLQCGPNSCTIRRNYIVVTFPKCNSLVASQAIPQVDWRLPVSIGKCN